MINNFRSRDAWTCRSVAFLTFFSGTLTIIRTLVVHWPDRMLRWLEPLGFHSPSRSLNLLLAVISLYVALQLLERKLVAWWIAVVATMLLIINGPAGPGGIFISAYYFMVLVALVLTKDFFRGHSDIPKMRRGLLVFAGSIALALIYGTIGFWLMDQRDFGVNFTLQQAFTQTLNQYSLIGGNLSPRTHYADWFLDSLGILGAASALFGLYSLFRPLAYERSALPVERRRMEELLEEHSNNTEDFFKLWPHDKSYFFTKDGRGALAYGVEGGVAMTVGEPAGDHSAGEEAIAEFQQHCMRHGWLDCYMMYLSDAYRDTFEAAGCTFFKIGEDAVVSIENFTTLTAQNKHFRNINNRFEKAGYTTEFSRPPHNPKLLQEVAAVSAVWLQQPGRKEWRFFTGRFSPAYMAMTYLFVARDAAGRVQAFANQIPTYVPGWATIDLMRYRPEAPSNIMDYLLMGLMFELKEQGYKKFNLGLAPLSGLDIAKTGPQEKLLHLVYESKQPFVSVQGLRRFKDKFEPAWEPRYMAYRGGMSALPKIAYGLGRLMYKR